jgi:hypothetical protein
MDETKLTARLPNLEVEIIRREDPAQNAELLTLNFRAVPSFDAFGRYLLGSKSESTPLTEAGPFGLWLKLWQQAWAPWLEIAKAVQETGEKTQAATKELADRSPGEEPEPKYAAG